MNSPLEKSTHLKAWLVALTGPAAGSRYELVGKMIRLGRDPENHIVPLGDRSASVSAFHAKITREGHSYRIYDLESTNGTMVGEQGIEDAILESGAVIQLGGKGPRFRFVIEDEDEDDPYEAIAVGADKQTLIQPIENKAAPEIRRKKRPIDDKAEAMLANAVQRAREVRSIGGGETTVIMRELLMDAFHRQRRRYLLPILSLLLALAVVSLWSIHKIRALSHQKEVIDEHILLIERRLEMAQEPDQLTQLINELETYQERAHKIQRNLLYQVGQRDAEEDFIKAEIRTIMMEFGAPGYSIPPEFVAQVRAYINKYKDRDRAGIDKALGSSRDELQRIRKQLQKQHLPPDLAYMVLVESAFQFKATSRAGAAGPWQFVPGTARAYGLRVSRTVDDRFDIEKSTHAAGRYIRHLILEFGNGSSVMLALAAYNLGPTRVKRAIRKVEDPIRQRDFWYLYRVRALPAETREYVPKIIAAIIIGRNPERFGFTV